MVRAAGWLSVLGGVAGVLVSLAVVAGVWVVRGQVDAQIVSLTDDLDVWVGRAESTLAEVETRLDGVRGRLGQIRERGENAVRSGTAGQEVLDDLLDALDREFGDEYRQFRATWATLFTRVETIMDSFDRVRQVLPSLPAMPLSRGELDAANQRVQQIDAGLSDLRNRVSSAAESVTAAVQRLVDGLRRIDDGVGSLVASVRSYGPVLQSVRAVIQETRATTLGWLNVAAVALTLVLAYAALAHGALVVYGWGSLQRLAQSHPPAVSQPSLDPS